MNLPRLLPKVVSSLTLAVTVFAQSFSFEGRVVNVISGDTIEVQSKANTRTTVKCIGLSAPVMSDVLGPLAQKRLASLVSGKQVTIEYSRKDQDGRVLGKIYSDGRDVCLDQLAGGAGWQHVQGLSALTSSDRERYAGAADSAKRQGYGVWRNSTPAASSVDPQTSSTGNTLAVNPAPASPPAITQPDILTSSSSGDVHVRSYIRKDGTFVREHMRSHPDGDPNNNWSTEGNVNPYTLKPGTKPRSWFARNRWFVTSLATIGLGLGIYYGARAAGGLGGIPCNDGTTSNAAHRQGACSHHGGIVPGH